MACSSPLYPPIAVYAAQASVSVPSNETHVVSA